jgi:hypothetical protein
VADSPSNYLDGIKTHTEYHLRVISSMNRIRVFETQDRGLIPLWPTNVDTLSNMLYTRKNKGITWQRFI